MGPCATPPPTNNGAFLLACLAFPVPFCAYIFDVDPTISFFCLVFAFLPFILAFVLYKTLLISCLFILVEKILSKTSIVSFLPLISNFSNFIIYFFFFSTIFFCFSINSIFSGDSLKNDSQPNSTCSKDCSPTPNDCVLPGIWQLDLDFKRQNPQLDSLDFPSNKQGCWYGEKEKDSNDECCNKYYFDLQDLDEAEPRKDCNNVCGGNSKEDFCGKCDDNDDNDNEVGTVCFTSSEIQSENECSGTIMIDETEEYKLQGRWDNENEICYCSTLLGNTLNNCDFCIKAGSGQTNTGCD